MEPSFSAWSRSRPNLAGVGSGTSDFRSQSRPKKWRLRNMKQLSHLWLMSEANWSFYFLGARRACWPTPGCRCRTAVGWSLAGIPHPACGLAILFCCWPGQNTTPAQSNVFSRQGQRIPVKKDLFCPSVAGVLVPRTNAVLISMRKKRSAGRIRNYPQNVRSVSQKDHCILAGLSTVKMNSHIISIQISFHTNIFELVLTFCLFVHSLYTLSRAKEQLLTTTKPIPHCINMFKCNVKNWGCCSES